MAPYFVTPPGRKYRELKANRFSRMALALLLRGLEIGTSSNNGVWFDEKVYFGPRNFILVTCFCSD